MNKLIAEWRMFAEEMEDSNFDFMSWLKWRKNPNRIDQIAKATHDEVFSEIDCTKCANCCKTMSPLVQMGDIKRISTELEISENEFIEKYLKLNEKNEYEMNAKPCPFLLDDKCSIYEIRPTDCREFPHSNKAEFTTRRFSITSNSTVCPAVYHILKRMRIEFKWRNKS